METLIGKHWHHLPADEVIDLLESDQEKGLDLLEVDNRQKHSKNSEEDTHIDSPMPKSINPILT